MRFCKHKRFFNTTSSQMFFFRWTRERSERDKWSPARKSGNATGKPDSLGADTTSPRAREKGKASLEAGDATSFRARETERAVLGAGVAKNERARGGSVGGRGPLYDKACSV